MFHRLCGLTRVGLLVALTMLALVAPSYAASINWGDYVGSTVTYSMVTESSPTNDALPLFNRPTTLGPPPPGQTPCVACLIPGDSLDFTPTMNASSTGSADQTDGKLNFMVTAHPGQAIQNIQFQESGDTSLLGFVNNSAFSSVSMGGFINIITVDNVGVNVPMIPFQMDFFLAPSNAATDGTWILGVDGGPPNFATQWYGEVLVDLTANNPVIAQFFADEGLDPVLGVTKINVVFDNTLQALAVQGSSAFIAKKDQLIVTTNIPEPTAIGLAMISLAVGGLFIRRR